MSCRSSYVLLILMALTAFAQGQDGDSMSAFSSSRYPALQPSMISTLPHAGAPATFGTGGHAGFGGMMTTAATPEYLTPQAVFGPASAATCDSVPPMICQPECRSCCHSPCDESGRNVVFDVRSGFFHRSRPKSQTLFFTPTAAGERLDAADFDFGIAPGIEAGMITYDFVPKVDLELRATWIDDWSDRTTQVFSGSTVQVAATPPLGTSGPRNGLAVYDSRFLSTELNVRYRPSSDCRNLTLLAGIRAMRFDERLNAALSDANSVLPDELVQTRTANRLVGLQLGADQVFANRDNWCVTVAGRVGLYGNSGRQRGQLISLASPPVVFGAEGGADAVAFHAELGVIGKFRLSPNVNLVTSYRTIFIDGLALASEQLAATDFLTKSGYHSNGSVLLQAVTVGLEVVF